MRYAGGRSCVIAGEDNIMARQPSQAKQQTQALSEQLSVGLLAKTFPLQSVQQALAQTGKSGQRQRALPAPVMVYYVLALALFFHNSSREVLRQLLEGLDWIGLKLPAKLIVASKGGISRARSRLGAQPFAALAEQLLGPIAQAQPGPQTPGAFFRLWRVVSIDGATLAVADTPANAAHFGRPGSSHSPAAWPLMRIVGLVESGTRVLFGLTPGPWSTDERVLAPKAFEALRPGMLCLADRNFFSFKLWRAARATGADLLWRVRLDKLTLKPFKELADGSYLSKIYPSTKDRRHDTNAVVVRVIDYTLEGQEEPRTQYRLLTSILEPELAPAAELAALYPERWDHESMLGELKTQLRGGARVVLRGKKPELAYQEFYGLALVHYAVRGLMHEAAQREEGLDPDRLSYVHTVRVLRRKLSLSGAFPPSGVAQAA
jgi:hypothetical protein